MKIVLILLLFNYSDFQAPPSEDANAKFSQNDLYILREKSIIRGHYKDVASEQNGGLMANARLLYFHGDGESKSPLRNRIYFSYANLGHARCNLGQSMIVQFLQAYEINTIRIRFWDPDDRIHNFKLFAIEKADSDETLIHEGSIHGLITIKFSDRLVSKIRILSNGNSINEFMSVIKIQAFYAF
ncbi:unnamed protein product [Paramecium sonneborni]|uniref:Uncharacterized protein n=1 Tax=Paramecium sonneborni TaxID=65129 RepID=A0A8S1QR58_9CILI|nr:unnamed protein product [Paramecium sonneborni]